MRKTITDPNLALTKTPVALNNPLNIEALAQVVLSSEAKEHPFEGALLENSATGWKASIAGEQSIRLVFDQAQDISQILLVFEEQERPRTQEFVLRWSTDNLSFKEILRQQFNFSPPDTCAEIENYTLNLSQVKAIELIIIPDLNDKLAFASLKQWSLN